ncbi:unnamed protein product [Amaranthus hypochondriacus]
MNFPFSSAPLDNKTLSSSNMNIPQNPISSCLFDVYQNEVIGMMKNEMQMDHFLHEFHGKDLVPQVGPSNGGIKEIKKDNKEKKIKRHKYAFHTRTQVDILDDGYRWRKYGQKAVKNNKFPR